MRRPIALTLLALISLGVYGALLWRFPLERYLTIARASVGSITNYSPTAAALIMLGGIVLHGAYLAAVLICWRMEDEAPWIDGLIWGLPVAAACCMALLWPINSTDLFDYIFRGRMGSHYDANPYTVLPNRFKDAGDPLYRYLGWPNAPSAYGPLWELISSRMAAVGGTSVWRNVLLHKGLAALTYFACGAVIAAMTRRQGARISRLATVIWLWSPLALFEIVGMGHNDGLLVLSVLLAIWAARSDRHRLAAVALVVGALFKFLPIIFLPFVVVHGMRRRSNWTDRLGLAFQIGVITLLLLIAAYWPYWEGPRTLNNITVREKFIHAAPFAMVIHVLSRYVPVDTIRPIVSRIESGLLALALLWQMWHIWRHGRDLRTACFGIFVWYLLVASQWFQPWYVLWPLALVALQPARPAFSWIETWAMSAQASYLLQFFGLRWLRDNGYNWPGNALPAQALYFLIIFGPPLLVWAIQWWRSRSAPPRLRSQRSVALAP